MSYTIEFDRVFVKSERGITPCWLAGDNNVTTGYGKNERIARSWSVFHNLLGVTEQDILDAVQGSLGGYGEHWKRNGKWVDDKALLRWIKSGCKNALTVEEICAANGLRSICVELGLWDSEGYATMLNRSISSTKEIDEWIDEAKEHIARYKANGESAYPVFNFPVQKVRRPTSHYFSSDDKVLLKRGASYLCHYNDTISSWSKDVRKALIFTYEEAAALKDSNTHGWINEARIVSAAIKNEPYDCVLKFVDGDKAGYYVNKVVKGHMKLAHSPAYAQHYRNRRVAETALVKLWKRYGHIGTLAIEYHSIDKTVK